MQSIDGFQGRGENQIIVEKRKIGDGKKAIVKAKETAVLIAASGGFKLGKIVSVEEGVSSSLPAAFSEKAAGLGGGGVAIEPGSQDVKATITLIYEIR